jgi:hypothetical protein
MGLVAQTKYADLTAQVDGVSTVFTLPEVYLPGSVRLFTAGLSQLPGISGGGYFDETPPNQITTESPPDVGDHLEVEYQMPDSLLVQASGVDPFL